MVFALVAQRALGPASKLAATRWVEQRAAIKGLSGLIADGAYAGMGFLLDALGDIAAGVFAQVAQLLNLVLDMVFVDTTSTYFQRGVADDDVETADAVLDDDEVSSPVERRGGRSGTPRTTAVTCRRW